MLLNKELKCGFEGFCLAFFLNPQYLTFYNSLEFKTLIAVLLLNSNSVTF